MSTILSTTKPFSSAAGTGSLEELNTLTFGSSKNQKQVINKSNIPELIELIINNNKEYFDLKDNSVYLSNIIKIYQFKTKVLLEDVTGTILHLRNLFKSTNTIMGRNKAALSVADATSGDVTKILALKSGDLSKYLSNKTSLKLNGNNLVKDTLDTFSLFQYGDLDSLDADSQKEGAVEVGRKFDNNTQESSGAEYSLEDVEVGRGLDNDEFADISGIHSLGSETNGRDSLLHDDGFGFHNTVDDFEDHADDDGDFSLEAPRAATIATGMDENDDFLNMNLDIDDAELNLNTPPDSPRGKVSFEVPQKHRFVRNQHLQPIVVEKSTEIPKRVFEEGLKKSISDATSSLNQGLTNKVNKRFLEQLYSSYEMQTLSLLTLRQKKQKVNNIGQDDSNFGLTNQELDINHAAEDVEFDFPAENGDIADVSLGLDDHASHLLDQPITEQDTDDLQLMETNSENTFTSASSYLTSATPEMRAQREKDHIQQDLILSKTKERTNFNDLFADENMNKKDIAQLFLQVLNLSSESKISVEQIGAEIFVCQ